MRVFAPSCCSSLVAQSAPYPSMITTSQYIAVQILALRAPLAPRPLHHRMRARDQCFICQAYVGKMVFGGDMEDRFVRSRCSRHSKEAITGMERMGAASMVRSGIDSLCAPLL